MLLLNQALLLNLAGDKAPRCAFWVSWPSTRPPPSVGSPRQVCARADHRAVGPLRRADQLVWVRCLEVWGWSVCPSGDPSPGARVSDDAWRLAEPVAPGLVDDDLPDHGVAMMRRRFMLPMSDWSNRAAVAKYAAASAGIPATTLLPPIVDGCCRRQPRFVIRSDCVAYARLMSGRRWCATDVASGTDCRSSSSISAVRTKLGWGGRSTWTCWARVSSMSVGGV